MGNPIEPQTDRELLLQLNGDVRAMKDSFSGSIERLNNTIEKFSESLKVMEEHKLVAIQKEVDELKAWRQELKGGYKLMMIMGGVAAFLLGLLAKAFLMK